MIRTRVILILSKESGDVAIRSMLLIDDQVFNENKIKDIHIMNNRKISKKLI
jgi:hypothetical protein